MSMVSRRIRGAPIERPLEFAFFLASLFFASCSLTVDSDRVQCRTNADCAARGGAFAEAICADSVCTVNPAWACLSGGTPSVSTQEPPYKLTVMLRDLVDQTPYKGSAQVKLCRKLDVGCAAPLATVTSGGDGSATFFVDMKGFAGYVDVQADGVVPTLFFLNPIDRDTTLPVSLATPMANQLLLFSLGRQASPGHGNIVISTLDCTGTPAAGVSYSTPNGDAATSSFYTVSDLPVPAATATDAGGYGGLVNVPIGSVTVVANLNSPKAELARISLLVQEGAITYSTVVPLAN